jgi:hypothetical protein
MLLAQLGVLAVGLAVVVCKKRPLLMLACVVLLASMHCFSIMYVALMQACCASALKGSQQPAMLLVSQRVNSWVCRQQG